MWPFYGVQSDLVHNNHHNTPAFWYTSIATTRGFGTQQSVECFVCFVGGGTQQIIMWMYEFVILKIGVCAIYFKGGFVYVR
jgi:hypothetical protein